jgi:uroporphyrinogen-III decarboxylase
MENQMSQKDAASYKTIKVADRPNPGEYTPKERLLRLLRHEKVDRLPIATVGMSPYHWHADFPTYHPVLRVAEKHCEFFSTFGVQRGPGMCDPAVIKQDVELVEEGERKTATTVFHTPEGDLTGVRVHDRSVGSWGVAKAMVENDEDLAMRESLPWEPTPVILDGHSQLVERVGDAGLVYCNGIQNALLNACWGMSEEYRTIFCFTETERLRKLVEKAQERVYDFTKRFLEAGGGPVFRWYSIEDFVEPIMPPSFVDEFIVPYDREIIKLIHDHGCYAVMHCHGRLDAQIERMLAIGVDGSDCSESPPQNDIDLAGMVKKADGRMFIWGYIQFEFLARATKDEVYKLVAEAVEMGGTEGKYILSQAASPWMAELPGNTQDNLIHMIEAGVKYGGH